MPLTPVPHCLRLKTIKDYLPISLNAFSCIQQKKHRSFSCPPFRKKNFPSYPCAACSIVMDAALFTTSVAWKKHDSLTFFQVRLQRVLFTSLRMLNPSYIITAYAATCSNANTGFPTT